MRPEEGSVRVPAVAGALGPAHAESLLKAAAQRTAGAIGAEPPVIACPIPEPFLEHIRGPEDVRLIPGPLLPRLAQEVRQKINECVSQTGGHLASNLGVVELTIALHRVFDFRHDRLVFDVGHQVYPHKLLTGRAHRFHTLRQQGGLSGYPNPEESPYDLFHTAHAGNAVSSALGLALADARLHRNVQSVAVVGDGALTSGVVFEALNHAGHLRADLLVVFNDNGCAIGPTTGAFSATCSHIRASHLLRNVGARGRELLERIPYFGRGMERLAEDVLGAAKRVSHAPGAIFLDLGFRYFGPIDGHDLTALHFWLTEMKTLTGPKLLHVVTQKGRGLPWAQEDPVTWHGARPYTVRGDSAIFKVSHAPAAASYSKVVSETLLDAARSDPRVVAITAAMADGTGLTRFAEEFPDRCHDVGICEQHAISLAAALAKGGLRPVACIYSTFLQRSVDQVMHDLSLQGGLPVLLCLDRAGVVGDDGPTHHGVFDIAYLRPFPSMVLLAPKDGVEAAAMLRWALQQDFTCALRYPRDGVPLHPLFKQQAPLVLGRGEVLQEGERFALLAYGATVYEAAQAAERLEREYGLRVTVANARFCKPLDNTLIEQLLSSHEHVLTIEDHQLQGGFGAAVLEAACDLRLDTRRVTRLGIGDQYVPHGPRPWQLAQIGIDAAGIVKAVLAR